MGHCMKIDFTKKQYEDLVTLVYLGAWVINSNPTDDIAEQYEELEQYILSYSEEFGMEKYVEFDEELNRFFTTQKFEEDTEY